MDLKDYFGLMSLCPYVLNKHVFSSKHVPQSSHVFRNMSLCPIQRQITEQIDAKLPNFQTEAKITGLLLKKPRYINI